MRVPLCIDKYSVYTHPTYRQAWRGLRVLFESTQGGLYHPLGLSEYLFVSIPRTCFFASCPRKLSLSLSLFSYSLYGNII